MRNLQRMIMFAFCLLLTLCNGFLRDTKAKPQDSEVQQSQSIVDAARRSRALKKNATPQARVITNDDLENKQVKQRHEEFNEGIPTAPLTGSPNVRASTTSKASYSAANLASDESAPNSQDSEEIAAEEAEIVRLKAQLASAENSLHWQQRQLLLLQNTVYSNPAYTTTHAGKALLDSAELQIEQTQQEIDSLREPLADLEWRHWRQTQAGRSENGSEAEKYKSPPPGSLVLPQP